MVVTIKCYINHPNKVFWHSILVLLIKLMCHTPIVIRVTRDLFQKFEDEIYPQNRGRHVRLMPIRPSTCPMVACSGCGFYESHGPPPLRGIVLAHRHGQWNVQQSGHMLHCHFVCCCPGGGGRRGDTERVAQWLRLVAFMKALDLLHQAMLAVSHRRSAMAIKLASNGGTFVRCGRLFHLIKM